MTAQITTAYDRLIAFADQVQEQYKLRLPDLDFNEVGWVRALEAVQHLPYEELSVLVAADPHLQEAWRRFEESESVPVPW